MDSRQQFEAYILKRNAGDIDYWKDKSGLTGMIGSDLYNVVWVQNDYELWQASRESLAIELPSRKWSDADLYTIYGNPEGRGDCLDYDETLQAIHAAGIRTK